MTSRIRPVVLAVVSVLVLALSSLGASAVTAAPDAFSPSSYWNTPIGSDAVVHPNSDAILDFIRQDNDLDGCITLSGYPGNSWGMPVYVADSSDPVYDVTSAKYDLPPEFSSLRIPTGAQPHGGSDGEMVVYDLVQGVVAQMSKASYDSGSDAWSASGGSIAYLSSNGLDGRLSESDDSRNRGTFRGYPGAVAMISYDDVAAGRIDNVVKIGVNSAGSDAVFPLVDSDGDSSNPNAPAEGTRIRIRPDVNLDSLGLSPQALIIARGLQEFGMVVADNTGGAVELKLEDTVTSGRGNLWNLDRESLCAITPDLLEVIANPGQEPPAVPPSGFYDVPEGHPFESEIVWLADQGITTGCETARYCPDAPVTRGEMAVFMSRALGLPGGPTTPFADVVGHPYRDHVQRIYAADITQGCETTLYCPEVNLNRAQMAAFIARAYDLPAAGPAGFSDTNGHPFEDEIDRLAAAGITLGCSSSNFCPHDAVTRGQMAAFLKRAAER